MPGGRPTSLDTEAANAIVGILQKGLPIEDAVAAAGVSEKSYFNWMRRGERASKARILKDSEKPFLQFFQSCKKARSLGKVARVTQIERAGMGDQNTPPDWKAVAWLLERMHPEQFGRRIIRLEATPLEEAAAGGLTNGPVAACNLIMEGPVEPPGPVIIEADDAPEPE